MLPSLLHQLPLSQERRQDLAARGAKKQEEWPKLEVGTFLKYSVGSKQQPMGQTWNVGAKISKGGAGRHWPPRWRRPCVEWENLFYNEHHVVW